MVTAIVLTRLKNGSFSLQNGPPRGTTTWLAAIILIFQDDLPENTQKQPKKGHFWTLNWP